MKSQKKKFELIISPEAEQELYVSKEFYEQKRKGLGDEFINEIDKTLNRIIANPEQFPKVKRKQSRKAIVNNFPFGIYFAVKDLIINVLAVFHFNRNLKQLNKRL